jgi:predicted HicB family RNase H-like nuclease
MIKYRGYIGHFTFDEKTNLFHGRVANTHDLITFQGKSVKEIHQAFQDAIDEHLDWCKKYGKELQKPFSTGY